MRRGRIFIYLAFIIILGLVLFVVIWQRNLLPGTTGEPQQVEPTPQILTVEVIFVTQRVPRGTPLTPEVLSLITIPQELFYEGLFTSPNEVVGKLARFDLEAGMPLSRVMIAESAEQLSGAGSDAALAIPRGMVAVSVPIDRLSSVSYAPRAGDHVNVIVSMMFVDLDTDFQTLLPNRSSGIITPGSGTGTLTGSAGQSAGTDTRVEGSDSAGISFDTSSIVAVTTGGGNVIGKPFFDPLLEQTFYVIPSEPNQRPRLVSQNLLQDVVVLHVGEFQTEQMEAEQAQQQAEEQQAEAQPAPAAAEAAPGTPPPDVITLIITPQDAITLNYLLFSGAKVTLALRSAGDDTRVETESVTQQFLLEQYNISVPAKLPNGMQPIQNIQTVSSPTQEP